MEYHNRRTDLPANNTNSTVYGNFPTQKRAYAMRNRWFDLPVTTGVPRVCNRWNLLLERLADKKKKPGAWCRNPFISL